MLLLLWRTSRIPFMEIVDDMNSQASEFLTDNIVNDALQYAYWFLEYKRFFSLSYKIT